MPLLEKFTLLLPTNTAEMLHLLARESGQNIGDMIHEMALDRYMRHALNANDTHALTSAADENGASAFG